MPGVIPDRVRLYHFTPIDNLDSILQAGELACKRVANPVLDVSEPGIQSGRSTSRVPDPPGGTIHDFVPFYFSNRSPMLLRLASHHRTTYRGKQEDLVYVVTAADLIQGAALPFVFSDGHTTVRITRYFTSLADLGEVDWPVIASDQWADTVGDNDRKRRKQAEFLVKDRFPLTLALGFAVMNEATRERVTAIVTRYPQFAALHVLARPAWYYRDYA